MILVDTSVWVDHLRRGNVELSRLLVDQQVLCHHFVIGELACGGIKKRHEIMTLLRTLPLAQAADDNDVHHLIEVHRLFGRGLGWIDVHLVASALLTRASLWTLDGGLAEVAVALDVSVT